MNDKKQAEQHPFFPSGQWEGFYNYALSSTPEGRMDIELNFSKGIITGSGSDPVGSFEWKGSYDVQQETCLIIKRYIGAHSVHYDGYADENGIWGNWKIGQLAAGHFHIWPKKQEIGISAETSNQNAKTIDQAEFNIAKIRLLK